MMIVYSLLTPLERIQLGSVNRQFRNDTARRGTIQGIYGSSGLDAKAALVQVQEYLTYFGTPQSILGPASSCENVPDIWSWTFDLWCEPSMAEDEIKKEWYDENQVVGTINNSDGTALVVKGLWDIEKVSEEAEDPFVLGDGELSLINGLEFVNWKRGENVAALAKVQTALNNLDFPIPYKKLFQLMKDNGIDVVPFLKAEEPPVYGFSENAYPIFDSDCGSWTYLQHLQPGVKFLYKDVATNEWVDVELNKCAKCVKYMANVQEEYCASKYCFGCAMFCRDCTPYRTCSTCGIRACSCRMTSCCVATCTHFMCICTDFGAYKPDEQGEAPGHSFVLYPNGGDGDEDYDEDERYEIEQKQQYCRIHAPAGSVPFRGYF